MKNIFCSSIILFISTIGLLSPVDAHELQLEITNIKVMKGTIKVVMYNEQKAWDAYGVPFKHHNEAVLSSSMLINFGDIPAGMYAIRLYQDENDNGKMDFNILGIPSEDYGYSNNGGSFGPSSFNQAKFELQESKKIHIKMK